MPSIPTLICVRRNFIDPLSFNEWLQKEDSVYISTNIKKYSNNLVAVADAVWGLSWLDYKLYNNDITVATYLEEYEKFIRKNRWGDLELLSGKEMGCWCENPVDCHGRVLQKLFKEYLLEKRMTEKE